ncbi:MAG: hypothetical protein ACI87H_002633, partial [Gammaproteobacteria bacterium]
MVGIAVIPDRNSVLLPFETTAEFGALAVLE